MTEEEFAAKLDRWGSDLGAWPEAEQGAARALTVRSRAAWLDWQATLAVEAALTGATRHEAVAVDGLAARVASYRQDRAPRVAKNLRWAAVVVVLVAGFMHGALSPDAGTPPPADWFAAAFPAPLDVFDAD